MRPQLDPLPGDRHSHWTGRGAVPLLPPPVAAPPAPTADATNEIEFDALTFLHSFVVNGELRLRRRKQFVWLRVEDGREEVSNLFNMKCRVWRFFGQKDVESRHRRNHMRAVIEAVWRLCEAPTVETITVEDAACRFLAYHAGDNLRFEQGTWRDTFGIRHYDLTLAEVRTTARKFLKALRFTDGVPDPVTAADVNALLASAAQQSAWLVSMQASMAA